MNNPDALRNNRNAVTVPDGTERSEATTAVGERAKDAPLSRAKQDVSVVVEIVTGVGVNTSIPSLAASLDRAGQCVGATNPREEMGADARHGHPSRGVARGGEDGAEGGVEGMAAGEEAAKADAGGVGEGVKGGAIDEEEMRDEVLGSK